jgi:hypothetical protein
MPEKETGTEPDTDIIRIQWLERTEILLPVRLFRAARRIDRQTERYD